MCINMTTKFHERDNNHDEITSPFNNVKERWCKGAFYKTHAQHKKKELPCNLFCVHLNKQDFRKHPQNK
jgi:hypothetical protein